MKKLLLGFILLAALVAVSYFKVVRDSDREAEAFRRGHKAAETKQSIASATAGDSLSALVAERDTRIASLSDSVAAGEKAQARLTDSLNEVIASRDKELKALQSKVTAAESAPKTNSSTSSQAKSSEHEILAAYKQAVTKLPGDLSTYERSVAIREIRQETASKFAITVDRLNQIRERNNLEY